MNDTETWHGKMKKSILFEIINEYLILLVEEVIKFISHCNNIP